MDHHPSILVTGGTGFIGSHLVRRLVSEGAGVHVLARAGSSTWRIEDVLPKVALWRGDVTDYDSVDACLAGAKPDILFHLAGDTDVRWMDEELREIDRSVDVNLKGTLNLLKAVQRRRLPLGRLVRAGGLEEYGQGAAPYDEEQRESPVSAYSASQVAATHYCQMVGRRFGLPIVTLRLALVYGPAQSTRFFVPALITRCLAGEDYEMTRGEQGRDLVSVGDVVEALALAASAQAVCGEIINIGTGREHRIRDVAEAIVRMTGSRTRLRIGTAPDRSSEVQHLFCRIGKAKRLLDWSPATSLEEGLARTIAWYRERADLDLLGSHS